MSKLGWYWHRLRAMSPGEMLLHARKKLRQSADAKRASWPEVDLASPGAFPTLPKPEDAPEVLRNALSRDVEDILAGRWRFFGHLEVQVDDPPKWQYDYLVRRDVESAASAFKLNYRSLTGGVDSKLVWEPSRWNQLVRLAMAAYVLGEPRAAEKCVEWLEDWVKHNPPYRGWNWTSALEVGLRLIQFAWIDSLLSDLRITNYELRDEGRADEPLVNRKSEIVNGSASSFAERLAKLRSVILPPHVWYAWRHKSFGSSANNHLLGELVGCIVATARWPELAKCGASLEELQRLWEHEVLAQFAEDGGNKEQALNYQLFSWEFCWQAFKALEAAGRKVSGDVEQRLAIAARFFWEAQASKEAWDYGDSDSAFVVPLFAHDTGVIREWHRWVSERDPLGAIGYWLGSPPWAMPPIKTGRPLNTVSVGEWWYYAKSGIAICESGFWWLRWDLSPLGHLATAAHGHLDALHLSIWHRGVAVVVDPGTGAYHANKDLRNWLASRSAHNGPCPSGPEWPRRLGPFLWADHHLMPSIAEKSKTRAHAALNLPGFRATRTVESVNEGRGWKVYDSCVAKDGSSTEFSVRWQFAPDCCIKRLDERQFLIRRHEIEIRIEVSEGWADVRLVELDELQQRTSAGAGTDDKTMQRKRGQDHWLAGTVSPAFRKTVWAPYLKLVARPQGDKPCVFNTTFLASARS